MVSRETPPIPTPALPPWLEPARPVLEAYVHILATDAVERGLIGPREADRLWERHVLNCAVVADPSGEWLPAGSRCVDVGSGAGLPGLVWAIARADITVVLVEPLLRRSTFLSEVVARLDLGDRVTVVRGRAEDLPELVGTFDVATARAVAPLVRLLDWTVPLLRTGGRLVALKGQSAAEEIAAAGPRLATSGLAGVRVTEAGAGIVDPPTVVIVGTRGGAQ
jgi:16S rRNA (guanine527-N7)-methyltransferase